MKMPDTFYPTNPQMAHPGNFLRKVEKWLPQVR
jgi:hypothetical protein